MIEYTDDKKLKEYFKLLSSYFHLRTEKELIFESLFWNQPKRLNSKLIRKPFIVKRFEHAVKMLRAFFNLNHDF